MSDDSQNQPELPLPPPDPPPPPPLPDMADDSLISLLRKNDPNVVETKDVTGIRSEEDNC